MFLVGPRGAGKTSAGRLAASMLDRPFVDTDARIEEHTGRTVAEIFAGHTLGAPLRSRAGLPRFAHEGEPRFRALERELLLELLAGPERCIVATGGGCILDPDVRAALARRPGVVWLSAPLCALQQRIQGSGRPSLTGADPVDELALLVRTREPLYRESCQCGVRLDTGELSPARVAAFIARRYHALVEGGA